MTSTEPADTTAPTDHLRDDLHEHATRMLEGTGIDLDTALRIATQTGHATEVDQADEPAADPAAHPAVIAALRDGWTTPDHATTHLTTAASTSSEVAP